MVFKHNKQPFAEDSYSFAHKYPRQLDCFGQTASLAEYSSLCGTPGKHLDSDGEKECNVRLGSDDNGREAAMSAHSKRPFCEDKFDEGGFKRARQVDQNSHVDLSRTSEGSEFLVVTGDALENRNSAAVPEDLVIKVPNSIFRLPWFTSTRAEEDTRLESPIRLSFFPGYYEEGHRTTSFDQPEEAYSPVLDIYAPRKTVPIGPNHQAEVPILRSQDDEDSIDKWMGTCVMPVPDIDSLACELRLGNNETECRCPDEGSIRCTQQHVMEAREKLLSFLGQERYTELGLHDMGEVVAEKWTEEEEELFHNVVASNPASLGKNFWNVLPRAFPSRSNKELVSYYFNVFMLRKRAGQNRADSSNVDSDDDEWQESSHTELATVEEEEEDSVVESPYDSSEEEAEDGDDSYGVSEGCISEKPAMNGIEDQDLENDSCTSFEGQHNIIQSCGVGPTEYRNEGLSITCDYFGSHTDPKIWDMSYTRGTEKDVEFLPTCNVIEEFGKSSWDE